MIIFEDSDTVVEVQQVVSEGCQFKPHWDWGDLRELGYSFKRLSA